MKTILFPCILLICLVNAFPVQAQWQQTNGPLGGYSLGGYYYNARLYADGVNFYSNVSLHPGNLSTSSDNGHTWSEINTPGTLTPFDAVAFADTIIYLSKNSVFYRSTNKGATWDTLKNGIGNPSFTAIAAKDSLIFASGANGIYYSHNYGNNWSLVNTGLPTGTKAIHFLIYNSTVILSASSGIYYSGNYGMSWLATSVTMNINILAENNGNLYAGGNGIYESTNGGVNWTNISNQNVNNLVVQGTTLYASSNDIRISTNNGISWSPLNAGLYNYNISVGDIAVNSNGIILCQNTQGIFGLSGNRWSFYSGMGLKSNIVYGLATNDSIIYAAASYNGVYKTIDNGDNWISSDSGLPLSRAISIAARDNFVYAGFFGKGLYRSSDYGNYWSSANNGLTDTLINCLATKQNVVIASAYPGGIYISFDNGANWTQANNGLTDYSIESISISGNEAFCATTVSGIFKTSLNNINWQSINNGDTKYTVYPADSPHVYASISKLTSSSKTSTLFRSDDWGDTWIPLITPYTVDYLITGYGQSIVTKDSLVFITGTPIPFYSTNYGKTWNIDTVGWKPDTTNCAIIKDGYVFVGTYASSVWRGSTPLISGLNPVTNKADNIKAYPNPFNDKVTFNLPEEIYGQKTSITIFDLLGKEIKTFNLGSERKISIDLINTSSGLYFYKIQLSDGSIYTGKIIRE